MTFSIGTEQSSFQTRTTCFPIDTGSSHFSFFPWGCCRSIGGGVCVVTGFVCRLRKIMRKHQTICGTRILCCCHEIIVALIVVIVVIVANVGSSKG